MKISAARLCIFGSRESGHFQLSRNFCPSAWSPVRPGSIPSLGQFLWRKGHKGTSWWTNDALIKNYHPTTTKGSPAWPVSRFLSFSPVRLPLVSQIHPLSLFIESTLFLSVTPPYLSPRNPPLNYAFLAEKNGGEPRKELGGRIKSWSPE